jgi:hypothetical protein
MKFTRSGSASNSMTMDDEQAEELGVAESRSPDRFPVNEQEEPAAVTTGSERFLNTDGEFVLEETPASDPPDALKTESIWKRLRRLVSGENYRLDDPAFSARLNRLSDAVEAAPDQPANYVLRGELYMRAKLYELARDDFQRAEELAETQFERSNWGLLAQATRDRALIGLSKAEKKLSL